MNKNKRIVAIVMIIGIAIGYFFDVSAVFSPAVTVPLLVCAFIELRIRADKAKKRDAKKTDEGEDGK